MAPSLAGPDTEVCIGVVLRPRQQFPLTTRKYAGPSRLEAMQTPSEAPSGKPRLAPISGARMCAAPALAPVSSPGLSSAGSLQPMRMEQSSGAGPSQQQALPEALALKKTVTSTLLMGGGTAEAGDALSVSGSLSKPLPPVGAHDPGSPFARGLTFAGGVAADLDAHLRAYGKIAQSKIDLLTKKLSEQASQSTGMQSASVGPAPPSSRAGATHRGPESRGRSTTCWFFCVGYGSPQDDASDEDEDVVPDVDILGLNLSRRQAPRLQQMHQDAFTATWQRRLDIAYSTQQGSEANFFERVANLMREPSIVASFAQFDPTCSGVLKNTELRLVLYRMGSQLTEREMDGLIAKLDVNGNGEIDLWYAAVPDEPHRLRPLPEDRMHASFLRPPLSHHGSTSTIPSLPCPSLPCHPLTPFGPCRSAGNSAASSCSAMMRSQARPMISGRWSRPSTFSTWTTKVPSASLTSGQRSAWPTAVTWQDFRRSSSHSFFVRCPGQRVMRTRLAPAPAPAPGPGPGPVRAAVPRPRVIISEFPWRRCDHILRLRRRHLGPSNEVA